MTEKPMDALVFYGFAFCLILAALGVIFFKNPIYSVLSLIVAFFNGAGLCLFVGAEFIAMLLVVVYVGAVAVLFLFAVMMLDLPVWGAKGKVPMPSIGERLRAVGIFMRDGSIHGIVALMMAVGLDWLWDFWDLPLFPALYFCIWGVALVGSRAMLRFVFPRSLWSKGAEALRALPVAAIVGLVLGGELLWAIHHWPADPTSPLGAMSLAADGLSNTHQIGRVLYTDYVLVFQGVGLILFIAMVGAITLTFRMREGRRRQNPSRQNARRPEDTVELRQMPLGGGI